MGGIWLSGGVHLGAIPPLVPSTPRPCGMCSCKPCVTTFACCPGPCNSCTGQHASACSCALWLHLCRCLEFMLFVMGCHLIWGVLVSVSVIPIPGTGSIVTVVKEVVPAPAVGDIIDVPIVVDDAMVHTQLFFVQPLTLLN